MTTATKQEKGLWNIRFVYFLIFKVVSVSTVTIINAILSLYIVDKLDGTTAQVGLIASLTVLTTLVFRPITGYLVDRWGRKKSLIVSLFVITLLNFSLILPMDIKGLGIIRFIIGIPMSLYTTATTTVSADILPEKKRSDGFGVISLVTMVSGVVLLPNLGFILLGEGNFNLIFKVVSFLGLLSIVLALLMPYKDVKDPKSKFSPGAIFEKKVYRLSIILGFAFIAMPALFSFGSLYSKELGIAGTGYFLIFHGCGLLISRMLSKYLVDMENPKTVGIISIGLLLLGQSVIGILNSTFGFFLGSGLLGIGFGLAFSLFSPMALRMVKPHQRGACNATIIFGQDIGSFVGSYLFPWLAQISGSYGNSYLINGLIMVIPLLIFIYSGLPHYLKTIEK